MDVKVLDDEAVAMLRRLGADAPVVAVPLSYRLKSTLVRLGVDVLSDLAKWSEHDLVDRPGIGQEFVAEVREALAVHGLCLRGDGLEGHTQVMSGRASTSDADPLRAELLHLLELARIPEDRRDAVARLLGWGGRGGASEQSVSHEFDVPAAELRQLRAHVREQLLGEAASTPILEAALGVLEQSWPATSATAAAALRSRGLSSVPFDPAGVLSAARLLGRRTDLVIERGRVPVLSKRGFGEVAEAVRLACVLALAGRACATVNDVLAHLAGDHEASRWRILVADLVDADDDLEWLDPRRRWFGRCGLTVDAVAVLSRAVEKDGECSLGRALELLAGDPAVGPGIGGRLLAFICARADDFEIDGKCIRSRRAPPAADEPIPVEAEVRIAVEDGPTDIDAAARRAALADVLRARPETSLAELFATEGAAGEWLRCASVIDLALAALDAGVDRSQRRRAARVERTRRATPKAAEPTVEAPPAVQTSTAAEPRVEAPQTVEAPMAFEPTVEAPRTVEASMAAAPTVEASRTVAATRAEREPTSTPVSASSDAEQPPRDHEPSEDASTWSGGAASLSLSISRPPEVEARHDEPPIDGAPVDIVGRSARIEAADVVAVLRGSGGLAIAELEAALHCRRSRVRRLLCDLEADGVVLREGVARWTRYRIATPDAPHGNGPPSMGVRAVPIRRRRTAESVDGVRTLYYRPHGGADPQKVAAIVLRRDAITIEYAAGQRPFDALERIMTPDGIVTPRDGRRFWAALETAFTTSPHFFVS